jgi:uncharacterized protein (TIGR02757 family)
LSPKAAARLRPALQALLASLPTQTRVGFDPVQFPRRYRDPADIEVSALLAACLAYGRAELFRPKVDALLGAMGDSPAAFVRALDPAGAGALLGGFVYRFNVGTDVAVLLLGMGRALREQGSLQAVFVRGLAARGSVRGALEELTRTLRQVDLAPVRDVLGPERGLQHLLPCPLGPGAAKRLNLFLRWMVRGPDEVDLGIWRQVSPAALRVPLDTHIARMARNLGLTRRRDQGWRTAEEITAALATIDPQDPVRFDFALCHHGMSGACPATPAISHCEGCVLLPACKVGPRVLRRAAR